MNSDYKEKAMHTNIEDADMVHLTEPNFVNLHKQAIQHSDAVIYGCDTIHPELDKFISESKLPTLEYQKEEEYVDAYSEFYDNLIES